MKSKRILGLAAMLSLLLAVQTGAYTVQQGDTMWRIAAKHEVGTSELIAANPQVEDPNLIYPGQELTIPEEDTAVRAWEKEVVRLVNEERAKYGLSALTENWELSRVARYKAQDMCDNHYFSHTSPIYGSPFTMMSNFGISYRTAGENIAMGYATPERVVAAWMNSSGHRANILNSTYTEIGVGYVTEGHYCSQMFRS